MDSESFTGQELRDLKEERDDEEYRRLNCEIEKDHPDWDDAQIDNEIIRRMTAGVEED